MSKYRRLRHPDRPQDAPTSNAYFSRPFCVQELWWAREAGIPIQPVIRSADKQLIGDFLGAAPDDLKDIGNTDFITLDRSDRDYWKAGIEKIAKAAAKAVAGPGRSSAEHPYGDDVAMIDLNAGTSMPAFDDRDDNTGSGEYDDNIDDTDMASKALLGRSQF